MTSKAASISTGNTEVTTARLHQIVSAIQTNRMYAKDRTRELAEAKKQILGSDLPPVAFSALWKMRGMSDAERQTVVAAVQAYERHLTGNVFANLADIDSKRLEASKDVRDAKKSAKELGVNVRALDAVLRLEKLDQVEREEMFNDMDRYAVALKYW